MSYLDNLLYKKAITTIINKETPHVSFATFEDLLQQKEEELSNSKLDRTMFDAATGALNEHKQNLIPTLIKQINDQLYDNILCAASSGGSCYTITLHDSTFFHSSDREIGCFLESSAYHGRSGIRIYEKDIPVFVVVLRKMGFNVEGQKISKKEYKIKISWD